MLDAELVQVEALRSRDRERIRAALHGSEDLPATLIPHVIPLLAWDAVANDAVDALRRVAEERVGALTDALIDPNQDFAVRRRLARVFSVCVSQRAVDGLLLGLDDVRFEVRFHCARSLSLILEKNPRVLINRDRVFDVVLAEVKVGRPVWEGHRLLKEIEAQDVRFADEFVKDRASRSLSHVFTLLSLVLPFEPLQIAYRGLHTGDDKLRGTALEYLESVLPKPIREGLWPFLEERRRAADSASRPREQILADLMRSNQSIAISLEELRVQGESGEMMAKHLKAIAPRRANAGAGGQLRDSHLRTAAGRPAARAGPPAGRIERGHRRLLGVRPRDGRGVIARILGIPRNRHGRSSIAVAGIALSAAMFAYLRSAGAPFRDQDRRRAWCSWWRTRSASPS